MSKLCHLVICSVALAIGLLSCTEEPAPIAVTSITLDSTSMTLIEGDTQKLTATVSPSNAENKAVIWTSSNSSVASVKEGTVTALKVGEATITAKTDDGGKTATCEVTVKANVIPVIGVTLDKTLCEMTEGDEVTLVATVNPDNATNKNVTWTSSNSAVASVSNGKVIALKTGTTTISVKTEDGDKTASCEVTVNAKVYQVEGVSLDKTSYEMTVGDEFTLTATVNPDNATNKNVTWTSSDSAVASVSNGKVTALKTGTTTISVKTEDGDKTATCEVTVYEGIVFLSTNGTANCYMISEAGTYRFTPTKGNSTASVGSILSAEVLWETFGTSKQPNVGDLINYVKYENGGITFATPENFEKGNAVIAARDASGNILWSWHIWLTDPIKEQVYFNNAGTMMDRNLGATNTTKGSAKAFGLLYQWGRKDPFLSATSIASSSKVASSTINWPSPVALTADTGTIEYTISNPTTYLLANYSVNDDYDWCVENSSSNGSSRWTTSEKAKSIYDPCPVGWRIPDGGENGIWAKAVANPSLQYHPYDETNRGMDFAGKFGPDSSIWYPCAPDRDDITGKLSGGGYGGSVWSASQKYSQPIVLFFNYQEYLDPSHGAYGADGISVRCTRE